MTIKGRVWKFGDDMSTDLMMPSSARFGKVPEEEQKYSCMAAIRPEFSREVKPEDIMIAGRHCGSGSSRPAPRMFVSLQVGCIVAESFSPVFFRNAIAIGFPVIEAPGVTKEFEDGDQAEVDLEKGEVRNLTTGKVIRFKPYPDIIKKVFDLGGVKALLKKEYMYDK
jgi:3-isopropylmalate/(R)-2-methylmalate dehydratase small subunit